jgi:fructose-1,6-bisphosphatase/inositol monophosphatase family enzyme
MPTALSPESIRLLTQTAVSAARRAGAIQLTHFRDRAVEHRATVHDIKLETDRCCEEAIMATIREQFPDHAILTEESGAYAGAGEFCWILDPLDGTVNFWHGLPFFCVSIACYRVDASPLATAHCSQAGLPGAPVLGVILLPFSQELFIGIAGQGAFLNGQPLTVGSPQGASEAVVTVSFGKTQAMMQRMTHRLARLLPQARKVRCLGAAAAELAYVAAGFLGGLMYEGIKVWDFAAGKILLEEAGGFFEAVRSEPDQWRVLAGASSLERDLRAIVS